MLRQKNLWQRYNDYTHRALAPFQLFVKTFCRVICLKFAAKSTGILSFATGESPQIWEPANLY